MLRRATLSLLFLSAVATAPIPAAAAGKAKTTKKVDAKAAPVPSANEKAVSELLGPWKWGMSSDAVLEALQKQLGERRAPEIAKMSDVYAQTQARKQIKADVENVRKSFIKFEGQKTGWDVSIIEGEFLHKNNESMLQYRETDANSGREQDRFFFFKDDKLWKQFIAFNMEPYKGKTFNDFREAMESRYGKGAPIVKHGLDGKDHTVAVAWRSGGTYLRAIDLTQFYSNFCIAFSDDNVEKTEQALRDERTPKHSLRAVVSDGKPEAGKMLDPNSDVIDRIVGGNTAAGSGPAAATDTTEPATPAKP